MNLSFTKMQSLGNDFVVIDGVRDPVSLNEASIRALADRRFGVGCDQVLVLEVARGEADFRYRIFNQDGGEVEQCGNGARCVVAFAQDRGLTRDRVLTLETAGGLIRPRDNGDGSYTVDMGAPRFEPAEVPFRAPTRRECYPLQIDDQPIEVYVLSMGNPHAVLQVADVDSAPVTRLGPQIGRHVDFPQGVNVGFMEVVDRQNIRLRVYERGAGETLACGTGACAAVVAGRSAGLLDARVRTRLRGGALTVEWLGQGQSVKATGPATTVFRGTIALASGGN